MLADSIPARRRRGGAERSQHPQSVHHSDDCVPDRLQHLSADLLARLLVHRFPRVVNAPASFVGLQNYRDLLSDDHVWNNFSVTAQVRARVGRRPGAGGLRRGAAAQPQDSRSRAWSRTLLLLPMMMSMAVVGLFWQLLYSPSWGSSTTRWGSAISPGCRTPTWRFTRWRITDIWMWSPFVMLLSPGRPVGHSAAPVRGGGDRSRQRAGTPSRGSRCRWWRRCC